MLDAGTGARPPISVFGEDYDTPDGTCVRDYIHVQDLASAHLAALARLESGETLGPMNLGTAPLGGTCFRLVSGAGTSSPA